MGYHMKSLLFLFLFFAQSAFGAYTNLPGSITFPKLANDAATTVFASNYSLTAVTASNAMTVTMKDFGGSNLSTQLNDLARFFMRGLTLTTGSGTYQSAGSNRTIVVPQLATLGLVSGSIAQYVWVYVLNDAGVLDLCVSGVSVFFDSALNASTLISSTATSGSTLYCSLTHAGNLPTRLIGRITVQNSTNTNWTVVNQVDIGAGAALASRQTATAYVKEIEASGVGAQSITSGSYVQRILNTLEGNNKFITLGTNQFILVPGVYSIQISCPFTSVGTGVTSSKCKLRNVTASSDVFLSKGIALNVNPTATGAGIGMSVLGSGQITITAPTTFRLTKE